MSVLVYFMLMKITEKVLLVRNTMYNFIVYRIHDFCHCFTVIVTVYHVNDYCLHYYCHCYCHRIIPIIKITWILFGLNNNVSWRRR